MLLNQTANKAIDDCIKDGILADFLRANKAEVIGMSIFEFNREEYDNMIRAESEARGEVRGERKGIFKTLYELVKDNLLSLGIAANKAGQSEEEFASGMEAYFAEVSAAK